MPQVNGLISDYNYTSGTPCLIPALYIPFSVALASSIISKL